MASATPLPARPPATPPTTAPTAVPTGPPADPTTAPVAAPEAAPTPTPTGCALLSSGSFCFLRPMRAVLSPINYSLKARAARRLGVGLSSNCAAALALRAGCQRRSATLRESTNECHLGFVQDQCHDRITPAHSSARAAQAQARGTTLAGMASGSLRADGRSIRRSLSEVHDAEHAGD